MRRLFLALLVVIQVANLAMGAEARALGLNLTPDMQRIFERGKLVVGLYHEDMPPFFMIDENGDLSGVDIQLAKGIANKLDVDVEFDRTALSYQALFEKVANGEVDLVAAKFSRTFDRAAYIRYTEPYMELRWALMVNQLIATQKGIQRYPLDYLRQEDVRIGARAETSWVEHAKQMFPNASIIEYKDWEAAVDAVIKGEIIAVLYDEGEVLRIFRQNPDIALYLSMYVLKDKKDYVSIAVPQSSTHLLSWLNIYLETQNIQWDISQLIESYPTVYR